MQRECNASAARVQRTCSESAAHVQRKCLASASARVQRKWSASGAQVQSCGSTLHELHGRAHMDKILHMMDIRDKRVRAAVIDMCVSCAIAKLASKPVGKPVLAKAVKRLWRVFLDCCGPFVESAGPGHCKHFLHNARTMEVRRVETISWRTRKHFLQRARRCGTVGRKWILRPRGWW